MTKAAMQTLDPADPRIVTGTSTTLATSESTTLAGNTNYQIERGRKHPLGATPDESGVNFALFSEEATGVQLLLFAQHDSPEPSHIIRFDPALNRSFYIWHAYVRGLKAGAHYAFRVEGPGDLHGLGHRFNSNKVLIDPYARGNTDTLWNRENARNGHDNVATSLRSVVVDVHGYDWEGDKPLNYPDNETIIYEMHVRGFTQSPTSGVKHPGKFAGIIEKIPYLQSLGITAVELLPVHDFDQTQVLRHNPHDNTPLVNYWGYSSYGFFAPQSAYCVSPETGAHLNEFRDLVKALHKAGIEVILDVVYNHTEEGDQNGPTISFRGLGNNVYYLLEPHDRQYYRNYSGCGNTVNANHPITRKLILESLEFWARELHVDGFRFDEAVILCRDENGAPMLVPPITWEIELSDTLAETKIVAEAWDAAGLYEVGSFPGHRWSEWNGRYRDAIRRFLRGDGGIVGEVATRIAGSSDLYEHLGELPTNSVNFVTAHDGFTLNDLVSYNEKHNEANGENNHDGINENLSFNHGHEGPSDNHEIEALREQQIKNFAAILFLSQGIPMFVMGDEVRRTQHGNNNAYCQDNETSWFDWSLVQKNAHLLRFFSKMIHLRRAHSNLHNPRFFSGRVNERGVTDVVWHGCDLNNPGWHDPESRVLAFTLGGFDHNPDLHVILNMEPHSNEFELPLIAGYHWHRIADTSLSAPDDFAEDILPPVENHVYAVAAHSVVILAAFAEGAPAHLPRLSQPVPATAESVVLPVSTLTAGAIGDPENVIVTTETIAVTDTISIVEIAPSGEVVATDIVTESVPVTEVIEVEKVKKPRAPRKKKTDTPPAE